MTHQVTIINTSNDERDTVKLTLADGFDIILNRGADYVVDPREVIKVSRGDNREDAQGWKGGFDVFVAEQETQGTLGHDRVRPDFYPTEEVRQLKAFYTHVLNTVDQMKPVDGEQARLKALALTDAENSAMWAVKAMTYSGSEVTDNQ